jgi:uncharacterized protein DUF4232
VIRAQHRRALLTVALMVPLAAACTSRSAGSDRSTATSTAPTVPASSTSAPPSSSAAAPTTPAAPSSTAPKHPSTTHRSVTVAPPVVAAPRSTCTAVTVRVIRGSAARGLEFAALQFTNDGTKRCTLAGYPTVNLRLKGKRIGTVSQPATSKSSSRTLAPGDTAESRLNDYTDCQAPLSDQIRVVVPGSSQSAIRPGQLRACTLRVSALGAPE